MDIFTTQLKRVLQTPIKPNNVKVKALVKEPSTKVLSDDIDHNESHEQYFEKPAQEKHQADQHAPKQQTENDKRSGSSQVLTDEDDYQSEEDDKGSQLDLYI